MPAGAILGAASGVATIGSSIAKANANSNMGDLANRATAAAAPMPQEIKALEDSLRNEQYVVDRERELIKAVDPALLEAGKQAYDMLNGKETGMLDPIRRQRDRERNALTENLRRQLGPGFETSSAGMEALSRFDAQTNDQLTQAQTGAIGQMLGFASNAAGMARGNEQSAILGEQRGASMFGNIAQRQSSAILGGMQAMDKANQSAGGIWDAVGTGLKGASSVMGFLDGPKMPGAGLSPSGPNLGVAGGSGSGGDYGLGSIKNPASGFGAMSSSRYMTGT